MMSPRLVRLTLCAIVLAACSDGAQSTPTSDGAANDTPRDSTASDGSPVDGAATDAGDSDAGDSDASATDAAASDGSPDDGTTTDAGASDAGASDAGTSDDGATSDAGTSDASVTSDAADAAAVSDAAPPTAVVTVTPRRIARNDAFTTVVTLDASSSMGAGLSYAWVIPDGRLEVGSTLTSPVVRVRFAGDVDAPWSVRVRNGGGESATSGAIAVNRLPVAHAGEGGILRAGTAITVNGSRSSDPDGDALTWRWSLAARPAGSTAALGASAGALAMFTPDRAGTYTARLIVNDGLQDSAPADVSFVVESADLDPPMVALTATPSAPSPAGTSVRLCVVATDASPIAARTLAVNGTALTLDASACAAWVSPAAGRFEAVATATDSARNASRAQLPLYATGGADNGAPTVALTAPADGAIVRALTDVVGTVTDADLARYTLEAAPAGTTGFVAFARGTTAVTAARLGAIDPLAFETGYYDLRLCAEDSFGNRACTAPRGFEVVSPGVAPGLVRIGSIDADAQVLGVPLRVARIYDSRRRARSGDFGFGWTMELSAGGRIGQLSDPTTGWIETGCGRLPFRAVFSESRMHRWTVSLGDATYRFRMAVVPGACITGGVQMGVRFDPEAGTTGTLVPLGVATDGLLFLRGENTLYNDDLSDWRPTQWRYTAADGTAYDLDLGRGLTAIAAPDGTRVSITPSGVTVSGSAAGLSFTRDGGGRVTRLALPDGRARTYRYDTAGDLIGVTDFAAVETRYRYDFDHNLVQVIDPRGATPGTLQFDAEGRVTGVLDASGRLVSMRYDTGNRQVVTDRLGNVTTFEYDAAGNVVARTDALGNTTRYAYDSAGRLVAETDPLGNVRRSEYDAAGNRTALVDALGNRWTFTFNAANRMTARTTPTGAVERFEYGTRGEMTAWVNPLGGRTTSTYDRSGRPTRWTNPAGGVLASTVDGSGNLTGYTDANGLTGAVTTDARGFVTRDAFRYEGRDVAFDFAYDAAGRVVSAQTPVGTRGEFRYDAAGGLSEATDSAGLTHRFTLDRNNNLAGMTLSDGRSVSLTRDAEDRTTAVTLASGAEFRRALDPLGRPSTVTLPSGVTLTTAYDAAGRITAQSNASGAVERFAYDAAGRVTAATLAAGGTLRYEYDAAGRRTAIVDAAGGRTELTWDAANHVTRALFADGASVAMTYDASGRLTATTDERGARTGLTYDASNRVTAARDAAGQSTTYGYDDSGELSRATLPSGAAWQLSHDALGNVSAVRYPWGGTHAWTRDTTGAVASTTDANGAVVRYEYSAGQLTARLPAAVDAAERHTYDSAGRVITSRGPWGLTSYAYDGLGRMRRVSHSDGSFVEYTYDARGRRDGVRTPASTTRYTYDAVTGLLATVDDTAAGRTTYRYDGAGHLAGITAADGSSTTVTRNARGHRTRVQVTAAGGAAVLDEAATRDPAGNPTALTESASGRSVAYTYDDAGRVAREARTGPDAATVDYGWDVDGSLTRIGARTLAVTDTQLTNDGTFTYTHDAAGRRTGRAGAGVRETLRYDGLGRLAEVTRTGATPARVELAYDGRGLLRRVVADGVGRTLLWDVSLPVPLLLEERADDGRLLARYVHGHGPAAVASEGGVARVLHRDALGHVRAVTDRAGAVVARHAYSAWGDVTTGATDASTRLRYGGEYYLPELGLYYLRARFYDPATGRFLTPDPRLASADAPSGFNPYLYAGGNPLRFNDPRGEWSFASVSVAVSIASTLVSIALPSFDIGGIFARALGLDVPFTDVVGLNVSLGLGYSFGAIGVSAGLSIDYQTGGGKTLRAVSAFLAGGWTFGGSAVEAISPLNRIEAVAQAGPVFGDSAEAPSEPTASTALGFSGSLAQRITYYFRSRLVGTGTQDAFRRSGGEISFTLFDNIRRDGSSPTGLSANNAFALRKFGLGIAQLPDVLSRTVDFTSSGGRSIDLRPRTSFSGSITVYFYFPLWASVEDNREFPNLFEYLGML